MAGRGRSWPRRGRWGWPALGGFLVLLLFASSLRLPVVDGAVSTAVTKAALPFAPRLRALRPLAENSVIESDAGSPIGYLEGDVVQRYRPLANIPLVIQHAVLAAEDAHFYDLDGVDPAAVVRSVLVAATKGRRLGGVRTTAPELAKLNFTGSRRSFGRKADELRYAAALERRFTKRELLERYLNQVYFGDHASGVAAAALEYFGTDLSQLSLPQAALLAGKIHAPAALDPRRHPAAALARRNHVLHLMRDRGWISEADRHRAAATPLEVVDHLTVDERQGDLAGFIGDVQREALTLSALGATRAQRLQALDTGGFRIETTLDTAM